MAKMGRPGHPPEIRGPAMVRIARGDAVSEIARDAGIGVATVCKWKHEFQLQQGAFEPMLQELVVEGLRTAITQFQYMGSREFQQKASAQEYAVAAGILGDKLIRLTEAMERARTRQAEEGRRHDALSGPTISAPS